MGHKITGYNTLSNPTGEEYALVAFNGDNFKVRLIDIAGLSPGSQQNIASIQQQLDTNTASITALNDALSGLVVNLNNTMNRVSVNESSITGLNSNLTSLTNELTADEGQLNSVVSNLNTVNQEISTLQTFAANDAADDAANQIPPTVVFDQAEW